MIFVSNFCVIVVLYKCVIAILNKYILFYSDSGHFTGSVISLRVNTESSQFSYFTARRSVRGEKNEKNEDDVETEKRKKQEIEGTGDEKGEMSGIIGRNTANWFN